MTAAALRRWILVEHADRDVPQVVVRRVGQAPAAGSSAPRTPGAAWRSRGDSCRNSFRIRKSTGCASLQRLHRSLQPSCRKRRTARPSRTTASRRDPPPSTRIPVLALEHDPRAGSAGSRWPGPGARPPAAQAPACSTGKMKPERIIAGSIVDESAPSSSPRAGCRDRRDQQSQRQRDQHEQQAVRRQHAPNRCIGTRNTHRSDARINVASKRREPGTAAPCRRSPGPRGTGVVSTCSRVPVSFSRVMRDARQERADHDQHHGHQAGHDEVGAHQLGVEPDAHARTGNGPRPARAAARRQAPVHEPDHRAQVVVDRGGRRGVRAVDQHLDPAPAPPASSRP